MVGEARASVASSALPLQPPFHDVCPFRNGLTGQHDWAIVEDRPTTLAFIAPKPLRTRHVLVILKRHAPTILDLTAEELTTVMLHSRRVAHRVAEALGASGSNVFQNSGVSAGQTVAHYHVHVLPSHPDNDPSRFMRREAPVYVPLAERLRLAERIASHLGAVEE